MSKEYVEWYGKCVESLFLRSKDSWVYRKVVEFSAGIEKKAKEEIIMDTKFRFRTLLDYTMDAFTKFDSAWIHYLSIKARETEDTSPVMGPVNGENIIVIKNRKELKVEEFIART